ncbi:hypothetical protein QJS04_geneDACA002514 [Acorus gramineus]|uniref:Neprosin PEP catalytic domain-containing protein n=1 Tax=Acorus gramineus TaxID=55184 RepID=A0AAV9AQ96_ACOGR|nr:hypothetical protein QJS04_geneDACA002514 [Acorus gramineus]
MKTNTMRGLNPSVPIIKAILLSLVLVVLIDGVARAEKTQSHETYIKINEFLKHLNKPPSKTIESEDGDIIDCIDIYKQSAFDHPSLKNHIIQMTPSLFKKRDVVSSNSKNEWTWQKSGSCPQGTVPIRRTSREDILRATSVEQFGRRDGSAGSGTIDYAVIHTDYAESIFYGAKGRINVWNVYVEPNEWSHSAIIVGNDNHKNHAFIEAGWSADESGRTGCYNLICPGFVQVSRKTALGATIQPLSTFRGPQHVIDVAIYRSKSIDPKMVDECECRAGKRTKPLGLGSI